MAWGDAAAAINDTVTAGAVLAGGAWAYFRFARGRVFAQRAELDVDAAMLRPPLRGLRVQVALKNTGASKVALSNIRYVETFAVTVDDWPDRTNVDWGDVLISTKVLVRHDWIESAETVTEDLLVPVPPHDDAGVPYAAFLVRACVFGERKGRKLATSWSGQTVVIPDTSDAAHELDARGPNR